MAIISDLNATLERFNHWWAQSLEELDDRIASENKWLESVVQEGFALIQRRKIELASKGNCNFTTNGFSAEKSAANVSENNHPASKKSLPKCNLEVDEGVSRKRSKPSLRQGDNSHFEAPVLALRSVTGKENVENSSPPPLPVLAPSVTPKVEKVKKHFPQDAVVVLSHVKVQKPVKPPRTRTPIRPVMVLAESEAANTMVHTSTAMLVFSTEKMKKTIHKVTCSPIKIRKSGKKRSSAKSSRSRKSSKGSPRRSSSRSDKRSSQRKRTKSLTEVIQIKETPRSSLENNLVDEGEGPPVKKFKNQPTKLSLTNNSDIVVIHANCETKNISSGTSSVITTEETRGVNIIPISSPGTRTRPSVTTDESTNSDKSVIMVPESPSPQCPRSKVIRTKIATTAKEPAVRGRLKYSLRSRQISSSVTPKASAEAVKSKKAAELNRSNSCSELGSQLFNPHRKNSFLILGTPKPMTPAEKMEKRRIELQEKESKQVNLQKKREQDRKKKLEERKRKQQEKILKVHAARELQEQGTLRKLQQEQLKLQDAATLLKLEKERMKQEEDEKRYAIFCEKKRLMQIKQQQRAEAKQIQLEKEKIEKERIEREKEEFARIRKAQEEREKKEKAAAPQLNTTVTIEDKNDCSGYDITLNKPQSKYMEPSANKDDYGIDHLDSEESTDEESKPKKKIPKWATGTEFKRLLLVQDNSNINIDDIFPHQVLLPTPDLVKIFGVKRNRFLQRTSSAHWTSPPCNM